jgi:hypothetical protein
MSDIFAFSILTIGELLHGLSSDILSGFLRHFQRASAWFAMLTFVVSFNG